MIKITVYIEKNQVHKNIAFFYLITFKIIKLIRFPSRLSNSSIIYAKIEERTRQEGNQ